MRFDPNSSTARFALPLLTTLCLGVSVVGASGSTGSQYVALRDKNHYNPKWTYDTVQSNPAGYAGRVIEVRGTVGGTVGSTDGVTAMLVLKDKTTVMLDIPRAEVELLREYTTPHLRALVKVGNGGNGNVVPLTVLAIAHDSEVQAIEDAQARVAARRAARRRPIESQTPRASVASRGYYLRPMAPSGNAASMESRYAPYLTTRARPLFQPYFQFISGWNRRLSAEMAGEITTSLLVFADRYNVDPRLVVAMVIAESNFNPDATSRVGAKGLGQLMPGTAKALGVTNPYDPIQNLNGSVNYLRSRLDTFADRALPNGGLSIEQVALALAAYNAGTNAVRKYKGIPPYRETQAYVRRIMSLYQQLCGN